jgi:hypothetical protein
VSGVRRQGAGVRCQVSGFILLLSSSALALGPHEIALLVNSASPASVEVANHYIQLRQIPAANVVHLPLPETVLDPRAEMTPEEFTKFIWEPANKALRERGLADHILAWAYSADFPVRIRSTPQVSLQGITFVRNQLPPAKDIDEGLYFSPLFRGPDKADGPFAGSMTFEQFTPALGPAMPLPSMLLGYAGSRGLPVDRIVSHLRYGKVADASAPAGAVYFRLFDDVRTTCRAWQYAAAEGPLQRRNVPSTISTNDPPPGTKLIGYVTGAGWAQPPRGSAFLPGAVADNLTSFGAVFHHDDQTKITEWLRAGATACSGTVTEPYAIWTKFPSARFFEHYAEGCTAIESYFLSLRCPLQILLIGEPLARPWGKPFGITLVNLQEGHKPVTGEASFFASASGAGPERLTFLFFLDGRSLPHSGGDPALKLDTVPLNDGFHDLRVAAYTDGPVRRQATAPLTFEVRNRGRSARLRGIPEASKIDIDHAFAFGVEAAGSPSNVALVCQERVLWQAPHEPGKQYALDPRLLGLGPNVVQAVSLYGDKEAVRSAPVRITVESLNRPPVIDRIEVAKPDGGGTSLTVLAADPDGDPWTVDWFRPLLPAAGASATDGLLEPAGAEVLGSDGSWILKPKGGTALCLFKSAEGADAGEFEALLKVPPSGAGLQNQIAALAFQLGDRPEVFSFFGLFGDQSAWALGTCSSGQFHRAVSRGACIEPDRWYRIGVRVAQDGTIEGCVDGQTVLRSTGAKLAGRLGLVGANSTVQFKDALLSPPGIEGMASETNRLVIPAAVSAPPPRLVARVRDHVRFADREVELKE